MKNINILCFLVLMLAIQSWAEGERQPHDVVTDKYKLAAISGVRDRAIRDYAANADPRKKCVIVSLEWEYRGEFIFVATLTAESKLEIVCFVPRRDGGQEWSGAYLDYEGEVKKQFLELLSTLSSNNPTIEQMAEVSPEDGPGLLNIRWGDGDDIHYTRIPGGYLDKNPTTKSRIISCLGMMESLAKVKIPRNL